MNTTPPPDRLDRLTGRRSSTNSNRVLIVEDSRAIQGLLNAYLERIEGIEAITATSLAEAQAHLAKDADHFFCSVLDLNLPDAPRGEIVDAVQKYGIPVVVLTGSGNEEVRQAMRNKLVLEYVIKRQTEEIEHVAYLVGRIYENQQVKVLIVDDATSFRDYLKKLLENYQYQVLLAENGKAGLQVLSENPDISLIITDYNMPEMDGLEMIKAIRQQYRREDLAIIGISDTAKSDLTVRLLKMGANDFITKDFEMEEFYCRVTQNTNMVGYVRKVRDSAIRDFLTRVYNRRHLFELATSLHANAQRGLITIATALIDADHFKRINDTHGHAMGDEALVAIAQTLQNSLRKSDVVARFGGEEFVCIAVIKEEADAVAVFEKVRASLEAIELYSESGERVPITASIGVTTRLCDSFDEMLKLADSAVYDAKDAGRNRVVQV
jgi:diguanylate cyclase (GGDEF)-like protein